MEAVNKLEKGLLKKSKVAQLILLFSPESRFTVLDIFKNVIHSPIVFE